MSKETTDKTQRKPLPKKALLLVLFALLLFVPLLYLAVHRQAADFKSALAPLVFKPLSLGSVKPQGWLLDQMKLQADGLTGHLDEFWPDVKDSGWIGGGREAWERGPYWLD